MNMPHRLPTIKIGDEEYFLDARLKELRNINNPHDRHPLCEGCSETEDTCEFFCDPYNTDGDCLMMK